MYLAKRPAPGAIALAPAQKITKPACKYGVPLTMKKLPDAAKKAAEKKPAVKPKQAPPLAAPQRRVSQVEEERKKHEDGMRKKRMELIEKERKQREQMVLLKAEQMKRYEKEKINRINQAREQGWRHVLSSSGGSSPERKCFVGGAKRAAPVSPCHVPSAARGPSPAPVQIKGPYEHYHAALDQMAKSKLKNVSREGSSASSVVGVPPAAGPVLPNGSDKHKANHEAIKQESLNLQHVSKRAHINRQRGQMPPERAFQVEEFLQRKREALINKVRAEGQLEYLSRLRQIRLQNFNERQQIKARLRGEKYDSDGFDSQESNEEAVLRRKKIEALKAQANARAAVLKEQLEKKRREAYEREKKAWEDHLAARGMKVGMAAAVESACTSETPAATPCEPGAAVVTPALPVSAPFAPAISMTAALHNVGAMASQKETAPEPEAAAVAQSEKKQILRRLNETLKAQSLVKEAEETRPATAEPSPSPQQQLENEEQPSSNANRRKWDAAKEPVLPVASTSAETCASNVTTVTESPNESPSSAGDRKKWEAGVPLVLPVTQQTMDQTCLTTIDQTVGKCINLSVNEEEGHRKMWGVSPNTQVLKILQEAELQPHTQKLGNASICEGDMSIIDSPNKTAAVEVERTPQEALTPEPAPSAEGQSTDVHKKSTITEVSHQETTVANQERAPLPTDISDSQEAADVESLVLEEKPKPVQRPPAGVQQAWEQEVQQPEPLGGDVRPSNLRDAEKSAEKAVLTGPAQSEEPLFLKLCSPAHRRTAALAILSAQSSVDESSSLASRSRSVSPLRSKHHDSLLIGLSTGMFDANNPKMLRTCSLPDLSRLFSSQRESAVTSEANVAPENNLEIEDLEEAAKEDDQSEPEDAYEDEDLRDIRASMERLLQEEGDLMGCPRDIRAGDFNGNPPDVQQQELFHRITAEINQNNMMAVDDDDDDDGEEEEEDEEDEECSNGSAGDEEAGELVSNGVGEESHSHDGQLNEEWHSDGSGEDQSGEAEPQDSIFSRLEELRFNLEQQMGFEKFIEAYNKIKAIHEDEDENIDLASRLVLSILGTEHQHLYPNILHLVMADGAYQEDNDE